MKTFTSFDLMEMENFDNKKYWHFECSMVSACRPVFNSCETNHEVEAKLRKAGVIKANNNTDTESCALVIRFSTEKAGKAFIDRLNKYLTEAKA